jgi:hypothetical protein
MKNHNNKHNLIKRNIVVFFLLLSQIIFAQLRFEKNNIWYEITSISNSTVAVYSIANNYKGDITIPKNVENDGITYEVKIIDSDAFIGKKDITSINIPSEVAFDYSYVEVFKDCSSLTSIKIPNGITSIGSGAFENCTSLTSITIPDSVTSIGSGAFKNCSSLTSIIIPDSVTSIGFLAFNNCRGLTSIKIPNGITSIDWKTFSGCSNLTSITIPNSVISISPAAFENCSSLTSITIPDSVTSIGRSAFRFCSSLTSIKIPNGITSIEDYTFEGCSNLTSITIPNSVTFIKQYAFKDCNNLTTITCLANTPPDFYNILGFESKNCIIKVPKESADVYLSKRPWNSFKNILPF